MAGRRIAAAAFAALLLAGPVSADTTARGIELFERGRFEDAAAVLEPLAAEGTPQAQYVLGVMYLNRMVEPPEEGAALALITASAEAGYLPAQSELARIYKTGDGVPQDFAKMMHWYEQAAEQGDVGAQLFVADGYAYGHGVQPDPVEAYKWYEIAIRYWGSLAVRAREVVAEEMTDEQIAEAVDRAATWFARHPEQ